MDQEDVLFAQNSVNEVVKDRESHFLEQITNLSEKLNLTNLWLEHEQKTTKKLEKETILRQDLSAEVNKL